MSKNETISVVMPTYNSSAFICRTLDCIYNQTVLPNELVITDDGSEDGTVKIIEDYVASKKNSAIAVKIFTQKNLGAGAARNNCIENASFEWIAFLDSDDIWDNTKIEKVIAAIKANPDVGIITHDEYAVYEDDLSKKQYCNLHENYNPNENLFFQLYKGNLFSTSCMVVKRNVILEAGKFDISLRSAQDYDLWIRCGKYTNCIFLPEALETYVTRKNNITANTYRRYLCELRIVNKYKAEILKQYSSVVIRKRIFNIHKSEAFIALKRGQIQTFCRIMLNFPIKFLFI